EAGVASFFRFHRGHRFASSVLMDPISHAFVESIEAFACAPRFGTMERYREMEWLNFASSEVRKQLGALFNPKVTPDKEGGPARRDRAAPERAGEDARKQVLCDGRAVDCRRCVSVHRAQLGRY